MVILFDIVMSWLINKNISCSLYHPKLFCFLAFYLFLYIKLSQRMCLLYTNKHNKCKHISFFKFFFNVGHTYTKNRSRLGVLLRSLGLGISMTPFVRESKAGSSLSPFEAFLSHFGGTITHLSLSDDVA